MFESGFGALIAYSLLGPVLLLGVVALAITVVAGGREPDPSGVRVRAVYLASVCFVSVFMVLGSVFAVASSLVDLIGDDPVSFVDDEYESEGEDDDSSTKSAVSGAVLATTVGLAALALFMWHRRAMEEVTGSQGFASGPARRAVQAYHYAVAFAAAFVALAAAAAAAYSLYRIAAPEYSAPFTEGERTAGARTLVASAVLLAGAGYLFKRHVERPRAWEAELVPAAPPPGTADPLRPPEIDLTP